MPRDIDGQIWEDSLCEELDEFYAKNPDLPEICALEQLHRLWYVDSVEGTTSEREAQKAWLQDFIQRWELMEQEHPTLSN